jgi:general secretion pathway protein G
MLKAIRRRRDEEGFTLIELLIVVIILAILATIVIFAVGTTGKNAAVAACKSTVKTVQTAIQAFDAQVGHYPTATTTLTQKITGSGPWLKSWPSASSYKLIYAKAGTTYTLKVTIKTVKKTSTTKAACTAA